MILDQIIVIILLKKALNQFKSNCVNIWIPEEGFVYLQGKIKVMNTKELKKINRSIERRLKKLSEVGQEMFIEDLLDFIKNY